MNFYRCVRRLPVVGTICSILNAYAFRGDFDAASRFASFRAYLKAFGVPLTIALGISLLSARMVFTHWWNGSEPTSLEWSSLQFRSGALIISVLPSLLGFGIGVYALTFALSKGIVRAMDSAMENAIRDGRRQFGSALVINADLACPLLVLVVAISIGVVQQNYHENLWLCISAWIAFWYAVVMMVEVIGVLFELGDHVMLEKRQRDE